MVKRSRLSSSEKKFYGLTSAQRSRLRWRKQKTNGAIVFRRVGQRDPMRAVRVIVKPSGKGVFEVLTRGASWFDFLGDPRYANVSRDVALEYAKKFMDEEFHYD